jgi:formylglycine-generating enzyme required for sulfatase activity
VGAHENSDSPYGTFDQGGNLWEWNEAVMGSYRGLRGGSFYIYDDGLHAALRLGYDPSNEILNIGFRVAEVP